mgnify:CR=1 FL=1
MKINIFGSTGEIGKKSLSIIKKFFPDLRINLLVANNNYKMLIKQINIYQPKYIYINNIKFYNLLKKYDFQKNTKILSTKEFIEYLSNSRSDTSILAISGYGALFYLKYIFKNTDNLGLVNKEAIVSAGHLFKNFKKKYNTNIYPLDSEHFSLYNLFCNRKINFKSILLTASGGPFLNKDINSSLINFKQATKHPKWKMGYKNSIDSATLANKCLEIIEAHYLFDIPYNNIDIVIHPEAYIHSIVELKNFTTIMNGFYPDMFVPIYNFLSNNIKKSIPAYDKKYIFKKKQTLNFMDIDTKKFPIYKIFNKLNKSSISDIVKFNCANEIAVINFKEGKIKYNQIHEFIDNSLGLDFNHSLNNIHQVIEFQNKFKMKICK